jgi:hypothetical protein
MTEAWKPEPRKLHWQSAIFSFPAGDFFWELQIAGTQLLYIRRNVSRTRNFLSWEEKKNFCLAAPRNYSW